MKLRQMALKEKKINARQMHEKCKKLLNDKNPSGRDGDWIVRKRRIPTNRCN